MKSNRAFMSIAACLVLSALSISCGSETGNKPSVLRRFCLPGSDGNMWEHVDLSDGRTGVPTGATC